MVLVLCYIDVLGSKNLNIHVQYDNMSGQNLMFAT